MLTDLLNQESLDLIISYGLPVMFRFSLPDKGQKFILNDPEHLAISWERRKRNVFIMDTVTFDKIEIICADTKKKYSIPRKILNYSDITWEPLMQDPN